MESTMEIMLENKSSEVLSNSTKNTGGDAQGEYHKGIQQDTFKSCSLSQPSSSTSHLTGVSQILPSLYLCGATSLSSNILQELSINLIINAAGELPEMPVNHRRLSNPNEILYVHINVLDRCNANLYEYFDDVADLIEKNKNRNDTTGRTLIHCVAGVSRSAALCLAYLIKYEGMTLRDAYQHCKRQRPQIRPNIGFFRQLLEYEERCRHKKSIDMIYLDCLQREVPDVYAQEYKAMEEFYQQQQLKKRISQEIKIAIK